MVKEGQHWNGIIAVEQKREIVLNKKLQSMQNKLEASKQEGKNLLFTDSVLKKSISELMRKHRECKKVEWDKGGREKKIV
jgi:hypothetical protein